MTAPINVTCVECDNEVDVGFDIENGQLDRRCTYCGFGIPHAEILTANLLVARHETRAVAEAFVHALRAFAKTIDRQVPLAPAYADGVIKAVRERFVDGPLKDAFR